MDAGGFHAGVDRLVPQHLAGNPMLLQQVLNALEDGFGHGRKLDQLAFDVGALLVLDHGPRGVLLPIEVKRPSNGRASDILARQ